MGGIIGRVLSSVRTQFKNAAIREVKIDPGGGANLSVPQYAAPGDDAVPLPGDYITAVRTPRSGSVAAVGFLDPVERPDPDADTWGPGGRRIYSRDATGAITGQVQLYPNGAILIARGTGQTIFIDGSGNMEALTDAGTVTINGVVIDSSGNVALPSGASLSSESVVADGVEVAGHIHDQANDSDGDTEQPTDPMKEP